MVPPKGCRSERVFQRCQQDCPNRLRDAEFNQKGSGFAKQIINSLPTFSGMGHVIGRCREWKYLPWVEAGNWLCGLSFVSNGLKAASVARLLDG
jgi:hypothetical protein